MNISIEQVTDQLKRVIHPETGKDIVSSGIVKEVQVEENKISFKLSFKRPNDPMKGSIENACRDMLQSLFGESVTIEIQTIADIKIATKKAAPEYLPGVKNIIAVASGKGGVGKSTIATNLAIATAMQGYKVGLIDADIYGPSIPKMFNLENDAPGVEKRGDKHIIIPIERYGIKVLSIGFFVQPEDATIWRGPMASNALQQLMRDADWGELDFMFIDLPPGTSDIHLTVVQSLSVTGAVIVSTPQKVALADAIKGINMFKTDQINVPVLGLVENMAWFTPAELPDSKYYIFGKEGCKDLANEMSIPFLGQIPLVQGIRESGDLGVPAVMDNTVSAEAFKTLATKVIEQVEIRNTNLDPTKKVNVTRTK